MRRDAVAPNRSLRRRSNVLASSTRATATRPALTISLPFRTSSGHSLHTTCARCWSRTRRARSPAIQTAMMSTPMSQETPSKKPTSLPLADAILAIGQGDFSHRVLISFSDLNREKIEQVRRVWALIEPGYRVRFLRGLSDLSEESVLYDFNRIFRLGLDDPDFVVRQGAVAGLWEDESSDLIGKYTSLLDDESQDVQAEAAKALGRF